MPLFLFGVEKSTGIGFVELIFHFQKYTKKKKRRKFSLLFHFLRIPTNQTDELHMIQEIKPTYPLLSTGHRATSTAVQIRLVEERRRIGNCRRRQKLRHG